MKIYKNTYAMGLTYGIFDTETKKISWVHRNALPERVFLWSNLPTATTEKWFLITCFSPNHEIMDNFGNASYTIEMTDKEEVQRLCIEMGGDIKQKKLVAEYNKKV